MALRSDIKSLGCSGQDITTPAQMQPNNPASARAGMGQ
jgi:hypothetical protein